MAHTPTALDAGPRQRAARRRAKTSSAGPATGGEAPKLPPRRRQSAWIRRALVFVTCVLMADALFGDRGLAETMKAREAFNRAENSLALMKRENAALREKARRLADDPATIESVAREELGLIKPGEILIVIKDLK